MDRTEISFESDEKSRRNHDGFLKYVYSNPENARTMLHIVEKSDKNLADMLAEVNLETLEEIPEAYNEVEESGEADLAFRAKGVGGEDVFFGILLEHKSSPSKDILSQIYRYTYQVMLDKSDSAFAWMPTKAIIIYNGYEKWDPLANLRQKPHAKFQGRMLPFEFAFVNLANIDDRDCLVDDNAEASIGLLTLKYAFNVAKFEAILPEIEQKLRKMPRERASTLVRKIELYYGEYLNPETLEKLKMAFQSIGQRLGFISAGDERRAYGQKMAEKARNAERKKYAAREALYRTREAQLLARIRELELALQKG